jgi:two-component system, OmpR family, sensor histidine kinase BaeS
LDGVYPMDGTSLAPVMDQNVLLTHLVNDLRTLAMADAGELQLEKADVDLPKLAQNVLNRFRTQADQQNVSLNFIQLEEIPIVTADPIRVEQILTNLISNALRFTPEQGKIALGICRENDMVKITVGDSGPGISEESLPYVFDRFYRADKARSRIEGGSGLGLAIARQLARAHKGDLTACNQKDGGAQFCLTLPLA